MRRVFVNRKGFEKLKKRQTWIYNLEIEREEDTKPGEIVRLFYKDKPLAFAFFNPKSKIRARVISFEADFDIDVYLEHAIDRAVKRREGLKEITDSLRLFHSDADGLSGLVVDMYGDNLVCSFDTAGVDRLKGRIVDILKRVLNPKGIFEKSNNIREKEGLKVEDALLFGDVDDEFIVVENGFRFITNLKKGQKTGFYLDQRKNRSIVGSLKVERVLDMFASSGGFGVYSKAKFVKFVEISKENCKLIEKNAEMNGLRNYEIVNYDAFDFLKDEKEDYDLIIIDPPAFAKNRNSVKGAMKGYKYLIANGIDRLKSGGYLAVFSCSFAVGFKELLDLCLSVSSEKSTELEVVEFLKQDIDHPYLVNIPTSLYLTGLLVRKFDIVQ
ncbi:class I SAM-dependent rRNA methyltransferase [Hippea alviniae]|uniref:class I SAM-dependent rRNA methyltransferase n=1 Tax=Hippea alviniae TaxID=1279027 RepID=UPI0003B368F2|nr:class I SAM-dependent rRNA methyltransferase [Hippea alviniae]